MLNNTVLFRDYGVNTMSDLVVVIEAPGKIRPLRKILAELRINAQVHATGGALYDMPQDVLGLDPNDLTPERWTPTSTRTIQHLTKHFKDAKRIVVMTDGDPDGELIAAQVNSVLVATGSEAIVERVTTSALNAEAVKIALQSPRVIDRRVCVAVMARRAIDRAIGFLCSNPNASGQVAGRVSSKIISTIDRAPLKTIKVAGTHPAQPGWRIWGKGTSSKRESLKAIETAFRTMDPELMGFSRETTINKPAPAMLNGADALTLVANQLNVPLAEAEKLMQTAYERGAISYPRTDSRDISPRTRTMLEDAMRTFGRRVGHSKPSSEGSSGPVAAHEAVYPCSPIKFNSSSLTGLSRLDSTIAIITRRAFASLSPDARVKTIEIDPEAISTFLSKKGLPAVQVRIWKDIPETAGWLTVEREFLRPVQLTNIPLDSAIMERMVEQNIGRPSTIVGHIGKALNRGWVHDHGTLSGKGQTVLAYLQQNYPELLSPHELDRFLARAGFDQVNQAVLAGINDVGLDFRMLQQMAREASMGVGTLFRPDADADESGLPTYAPEEDVEMAIGAP